MLAVSDLSVRFLTRTGVVHALDRVSLSVSAGEILGVVGESGSGKSVTAYAIMRLLDRAAEVTGGEIRFEGRDLLTLPEREMRRLRGRKLAMVFQNPRSALNPIRRVGTQIADAVFAHGGGSRREAMRRAIALLSEVRIPDPLARAQAYPFELSGGMCQRVMIALALAGNPRLLIADEPTTGLDVTVQAVVLALITDLVRSHGMACLFITHDLMLAAEYCDRIAVMHAGQVVEVASASRLFAAPRHPYTQRLLRTSPRPGITASDLAPIRGAIPDLRRDDLPACRYLARCDRAGAQCAAGPIPVHMSDDHRVACVAPT